MKKIIYLIIAVSFGTVNGQTKEITTRYLSTNEFRGRSPRLMSKGICGYINFYVGQRAQLDRLHTIALLPVGNAYKYIRDSINFPNKEWISIFRESVKAKLIKDYNNSYLDSLLVDTTSSWYKDLDYFSDYLIWDLIYSGFMRNGKINERKMTDSLDKLMRKPYAFVISPLEIDGYIDRSDFYRDNKIKNEFIRWGGETCYDSICDSLTRIVLSELILDSSFTIIPPQTTQNTCDSLYHSLDRDWQYLWCAWFYPGVDKYLLYYPYKKLAFSTENLKLKKQLSDSLFHCMNVDAYVATDVFYNTMPVYNYGKKKLIQTSEILLVLTIIGNDFKILVSADIPVSRQVKKEGYFKKDKYAYEMVNYNMARENIRRTLSLLKTNKAMDKFR